MGLGLKSLWGIGSGVSAAFAIFYLNLSRQHHDANTVLFYMFGLGSVLMFLFFRQHFFWPGPRELYYLALCGGAGIAGQFLITLGFRYVTAVEGGVISSTRILLAALLGPWLAAEPSLGADRMGGRPDDFRGQCHPDPSERALNSGASPAGR